MITAGRVAVNGQVVTELGTKADPERDEITIDGKPLAKAAEHVYILLNKPTGYVTTVSDPHASHTVMELVRGVDTRVYPVGRLDAETAGVLILTNDGEFAAKLTHPSHQVPKTYRAVVRGDVPAWAAADLRTGILLDDGMTAPAAVEWVDYDEKNNATIVDVTIHEGRNRQVRRMFDKVGFPVLALTRMKVGSITLKGLAPGTWRRLHSSEVKALTEAADSAAPALPQQPSDDIELEAAPDRESDRQGPQRRGERPRPEGRARDQRSDGAPARPPQRPRNSSPGYSGPSRPRPAGPSSQNFPQAQPPRARSPQAPEPRSRRPESGRAHGGRPSSGTQLPGRPEAGRPQPETPQARRPYKSRPPASPDSTRPPQQRADHETIRDEARKLAQQLGSDRRDEKERSNRPPRGESRAPQARPDRPRKPKQ